MAKVDTIEKVLSIMKQKKVLIIEQGSKYRVSQNGWFGDFTDKLSVYKFICEMYLSSFYFKGSPKLMLTIPGSVIEKQMQQIKNMRQCADEQELNAFLATMEIIRS